MRTAVVMAMHGRHEIVKANLLSLPVRCTKVVCATDKADFDFLHSLELNNLYTVSAPNEPLGLKWQRAVDNARTLEPDALIILGSDDFLSDGFIDSAAELAMNHDFVYFTKWYIFDQSKNESYFLNYKIHFPLGSGRIYSKRFLDRHNWTLFEKNLNVRLDDYAYDNMVNEDRILCDPYEMHLLSLKGKHQTMNSLDKILKADHIEWRKCEAQEWKEKFKLIQI